MFARTAHKLQRINWSLLRTSLLVTMSHVAEGFARYALLAPPTSSSFSSSFSPAEAVQGREGGAISEEATAASHGSSSSSSSSSNSNDTLGARCAWCWRAYRSWLSGVVGLLGDLEVGSNSEHIGVVVVNRTANMSVDKDIGAVFLGYSPFLLNYFLCISFKSVSPPPRLCPSCRLIWAANETATSPCAAPQCPASR